MRCEVAIDFVFYLYAHTGVCFFSIILILFHAMDRKRRGGTSPEALTPGGTLAHTPRVVIITIKKP